MAPKDRRCQRCHTTTTFWSGAAWEIGQIHASVQWGARHSRWFCAEQALLEAGREQGCLAPVLASLRLDTRRTSKAGMKYCQQTCRPETEVGQELLAIGTVMWSGIPESNDARGCLE